MRIGFRGELLDEPQVRAGFVGCGSHSLRNVYPTFQFTPVQLVATCDLQLDKARAFADAFGAEAAYDNLDRMLERDDLDAIFLVTGYDEEGRPQFPDLATRCLEAGKHVWMEKPPAATCADIEALRDAAQRAGRNVLVGMKKMFFPANVKARELSRDSSFGSVALATLQYPQYVPTVDEIQRYLIQREPVLETRSFLDHLVHPASLMVYLLGMPDTLCYQRASSGAGVATFTYASGAVATIAFTHKFGGNGGMERTVLVSSLGGHILVENNTQVSLHPPVTSLKYGASPSCYDLPLEEAALLWKPEFSLGQLYNKGLFLLGYVGEVDEFARSILEGRAPHNGTLEQAWQVTRIFEAFAEGPGHTIGLAGR